MLKTLISHIAALAELQESPIEGVRLDRDKSRDETIRMTLVIAGKVLSFALTEEMHEVAERVDLSRYDFVRMRQSEQMRLAQRVHDAALPHLAGLAPYDVTAEMLVDLQKRIAETEKAVDAPVDTAAVKKVATADLIKAFAKANRLLAQIDPLLLPLQESDPQAYSRYQAARKVFDRGHSPSPETAAAEAGTTPATAGTTPAAVASTTPAAATVPASPLAA